MFSTVLLFFVFQRFYGNGKGCSFCISYHPYFFIRIILVVSLQVVVYNTTWSFSVTTICLFPFFPSWMQASRSRDASTYSYDYDTFITPQSDPRASVLSPLREAYTVKSREGIFHDFSTRMHFTALPQWVARYPTFAAELYQSAFASMFTLRSI